MLTFANVLIEKETDFDLAKNTEPGPSDTMLGLTLVSEHLKLNLVQDSPGNHKQTPETSSRDRCYVVVKEFCCVLSCCRLGVYKFHALCCVLTMCTVVKK